MPTTAGKSQVQELTGSAELSETRKVSASIYLIAFLLSLVFFLIGIYIGQLFEQAAMKDINSELSDISEKVASIQLLLLSDGNSSSFCPVYSNQLESIDSDVQKIGYKLSYLEDEKHIFDDILKKKYFILEAESYLLTKKVSSLCNSKDVLLINFYSNKNCQQCKAQGSEVLKARDSLAAKGFTVKLFSFDGELNSSVADAFAAQYGVNTYPTLVINEKTYPGYRTSTEIEKIISATQAAK